MSAAKGPYLFQFDDINQKEILSFQNEIEKQNGNPNTCPNVQDFYRECGNLRERNLVYDNEKNCKLYKMHKESKTSIESKDNANNTCVVKVYTLPNKRKKKKIHKYLYKVRSIKQTYLLMKNTHSITPGKIYYNKKDETMMMTMECLDYDLTGYVQSRKSISEIECQHIIFDIMLSLHSIHKKGYLHCDIKPDNIMCRKGAAGEDQWIFIDLDNKFYVGSPQAQGQKCQGVRGTWQWIPPEMEPGEMNLFTYAIDSWAIGLIILYILFGKQPYELTNEEREQYEMIYSYKVKLMRNDKYDTHAMNNQGETWLRNYLIGLYVGDKISKHLFDLLHNDILTFNPRKRANCKGIWNHKWFDEFRASYPEKCMKFF